MQRDAVAQVLDPVELLRRGAPDHAVDLVALLEQQLGQVGAVLSGDAGDQGALGGAHAAAQASEPRIISAVESGAPPRQRSRPMGLARAPRRIWDRESHLQAATRAQERWNGLDPDLQERVTELAQRAARGAPSLTRVPTRNCARCTSVWRSGADPRRCSGQRGRSPPSESVPSLASAIYASTSSCSRSHPRSRAMPSRTSIAPAIPAAARPSPPTASGAGRRP